MLSLSVGLWPRTSGGGGGGEAPFDPALLFGSGEQGVIYDPANGVTVFQERTGASATTPSAADAVIGSLKDLSPNNNYAVAPADAARPLRKTADGIWWIETDGTDDVLRSAFAITQPFTRIAGWRRITGTSANQIFGGVTANSGVLFRSTGTVTYGMFDGASVHGPDVALLEDVVTVERHHGANSRIRADGGSYFTGNPGTTAPGGISIGAANTASAYTNTRYYRIIEINRDLSDAEILSASLWIADNMPP